MPEPVYSQRLLSAKGASGTATYIVPAGYVVVIRCLDMYASVTAAADLFLQGEVGQAIMWQHWPINGQAHAQWQGRHAFKAGEGVTVTASVGPIDGIDYTLFGYVLTA